MRRALIVRADANRKAGYGHLLRCIALSQAARAVGYAVTVITSCDSPLLKQQLVDEAFRVIPIDRVYPDPEDWSAISREISRHHESTWIVVDGYQFDETYLEWLRESGRRILLFDDEARLSQYQADIVLNQNLGAERLVYPCNCETRLLLGARYALLRRQFLIAPSRETHAQCPARNVLVSLGGADSANTTCKVIRGLCSACPDDTEIIVVVGGNNPHLDGLESVARMAPSHVRVKIRRDVPDMASLISWAHIGIVGGGTTCWEMAFMGAPFLCIVLARNQEGVAVQLAERGAAINLGWHDRLTPDLIGDEFVALAHDSLRMESMARRGRELVDGNGIARALMWVEERRLWFRQAVHDDARLLWTWVNDPETRAASFDSEFIEWNDHLRWLQAKLSDPDCVLLIAHDTSDYPLGVIRLDRNGEIARVSVSVAPGSRGYGLASEMIALATRKMLYDGRTTRFEAYVKLDNIKSLRAFRTAGFVEDGVANVNGKRARCMVLREVRI